MPQRPRRLITGLCVALFAAGVLAGGSLPAQAEPDEPSSGTIFDLLPSAGAYIDETPGKRVTVEVYAVAGIDLAQLERMLSSYVDIVTVSPEYGVVAGKVDSADLDVIRDMPEVDSIVVPPSPVSGGHAATGVVRAEPGSADGTIPAPSCRAVPVEADDPLSGPQAREVFGVDGSGVTVGIISDSFDVYASAETRPADDVKLGSLPGAENPCGYRSEVTVVRDADPDDTWPKDEGRAMAQLVHGLAPGAELLFANAGNSMYEMADAIDLLVDAGADIIVDDITFYGSPMYQQGPIDSAIERARAEGVSHYSSAGNSSFQSPDGRQAGSWIINEFVATDCPEAIVAVASSAGCLNFGTEDEPDSTNRITYTRQYGDPGLTMLMHWAEPWNGVETPLLILALTPEETPQVVAAGICSNTSEPPLYTCSQSIASMGLGSIDLPIGEPVELDIVVVRVLNPGSDGSSLGFPGVRLQVRESVASLQWEHGESRPDGSVLVGPTLSVNNAGPNVFTVGGAPYDDPNMLRGYSAFGPYTHLFEPLGSVEPGVAAPPLPEAWVRQGPDAVSLDGIQTSFFMPEGGGVSRFYGTSAASPHMAGIAALVRSAHLDSPLGVEAEFDALRGATSPVSAEALGPDVEAVHATGTGLVDAAGALLVSGAPADRFWHAPVPPDVIPASAEGLRAETCEECTLVLPAMLRDGVLTVDGSALDGAPGVGPDEWVWLFGYSEPVNLGWVRFNDDVTFDVDVSHLGQGEHTLAMFHGTRQIDDEVPILVAVAEFTLPGPGPEPTPTPSPTPVPPPGPGPDEGDTASSAASTSGLAVSGFDASWWPLPAIGVIVIGGVLLVVGVLRRRSSKTKVDPPQGPEAD